MADLHVITPRAAPPAQRGFIETEAAKPMLATLHRVRRDGEKIGLIAGAPGVGKSEAVRQFMEEIQWDGHLHVAIAAEGGAWNTAQALWRMLGLEERPNGRDLAGARERIAEELTGKMLVIDEAQNLVDRNQRGSDNWHGLEWLRQMFDHGGFSLALVGSLELREIATRLPGLWRRTRRTIVASAPKPDVTAVAAQWGLHDPKAADLLFKMQRRTGGALGDVVTACKEARLLAGNRPPVTADLAAALESLGWLFMGGK
jgi:DNA transposition AAA+ family ATPase